MRRCDNKPIYIPSVPSSLLTTLVFFWRFPVPVPGLHFLFAFRQREIGTVVYFSLVPSFKNFILDSVSKNKYFLWQKDTPLGSSGPCISNMVPLLVRPFLFFRRRLFLFSPLQR